MIKVHYMAPHADLPEPNYRACGICRAGAGAEDCECVRCTRCRLKVAPRNMDATGECRCCQLDVASGFRGVEL